AAVLQAEADQRVLAGDATGAAVPNVPLTPVGGGRFEADLTEAVRQALRDGKTRITVRVTSSSSLTQAVWPGDGTATGLQMTRAGHEGVVFDVFDEQGHRLAGAVPLLDLRNLAAGTYFLRVFNPNAATQTAALPYGIEVRAPLQGATHPDTDRDVLAG